MYREIAMPLWLVAVLVALAAWAVLDRMLVPGARWFLKRRASRLLEKINTRLHIRIQPFKLAKREVLIDRLLFDPQVLEAAEAFAREQAMPRDVVMKKVETYANGSSRIQHLRLLPRGIRARAASPARLLYRVRLGADEAIGAVPEKSTVVFLMNHRSNMDYILIGYLAAEKTALSYAVGEWARIWPLQTLIRAMGAYFVRRNSRDGLYRKVLERYVAMATAAGVTQAVFPEGGLSRDGKLRPPKLGILDYMVRSFDRVAPLTSFSSRPASTSTARSRTAPRSLALEGLLGRDLPRPSPRPRVSCSNGMLVARNAWHRFGYACVNFGKPVSLKAWLLERQLDLRPLAKEERFVKVEELAKDLMAAIARVIPVLPVSLVATVFVDDPAKAWSELELKAEVLRRIQKLQEAGAQVYVPRQDQDYAIGFGLQALAQRHLVEEKNGLYRARAEELPLLAYYANSIAHLFPR